MDPAIADQLVERFEIIDALANNAGQRRLGHVHQLRPLERLAGIHRLQLLLVADERLLVEPDHTSEAGQLLEIPVRDHRSFVDDHLGARVFVAGLLNRRFVASQSTGILVEEFGDGGRWQAHCF